MPCYVTLPPTPLLYAAKATRRLATLLFAATPYVADATITPLRYAAATPRLCFRRRCYCHCQVGGCCHYAAAAAATDAFRLRQLLPLIAAIFRHAAIALLQVYASMLIRCYYATLSPRLLINT